MRIASIVGARPQFIKAAAVSNAIRRANHSEILIHTGQHYDYAMSRIFFDELRIPEPDFNLEVGSGSHGTQTGRMLERTEAVLQEQEPDCVIVYGDTNSTLAGALAACKLGIPIAHVEAGMRSFNRAMPEEYNRVVVDHCSDYLFCASQASVNNLEREGITNHVAVVGDTMFDVLCACRPLVGQREDVLDRYGLQKGAYALATVHRASNTGDAVALGNILDALREMKEVVVFPVHPRTKKAIESFGLLDPSNSGSLKMIDPVGFLEMLVLESNARLILTDSGGVQKEAFYSGVPCITLREETEWTETVDSGWNVLVGSNRHRILKAVDKTDWPRGTSPAVYGDGRASDRIVGILQSGLMRPGRSQLATR